MYIKATTSGGLSSTWPFTAKFIPTCDGSVVINGPSGADRRDIDYDTPKIETSSYAVETYMG